MTIRKLLIPFFLILSINAQSDNTLRIEDIKEAIKNTYGVELDISGGIGSSQRAPVLVDTKSIYASLITERTFIRFLADVSDDYWMIHNVNSFSDERGYGVTYVIRSFRYKNEEWANDHVDREISFVRRGSYSGISKMPKSFPVYQDKRTNVLFYTETPFINFAKLEHYDDKNLGYSIKYEAPRLSADVYVYGENGSRDVIREAKYALDDVKSVKGEDTVSDVKQAVCNSIECSYSYTIKNVEGADGYKSWIVVTDLKGSYVKFRLTFPDTKEHEELAKRFVGEIKRNFIFTRSVEVDDKPWWSRISKAQVLTKTDHTGVMVEGVSSLSTKTNGDGTSSLVISNPVVYELDNKQVSSELRSKMASFSTNAFGSAYTLVIDKSGELDVEKLSGLFDKYLAKLKLESKGMLNNELLKATFLAKSSDEWELMSTPYKLLQLGYKSGDSKVIPTSVSLNDNEIPIEIEITLEESDLSLNADQITLKTTYDSDALTKASLEFGQHLFKRDVKPSGNANIKLNKTVVSKIVFDSKTGRPFKLSTVEETNILSGDKAEKKQTKFKSMDFFWE